MKGPERNTASKDIRCWHLYGVDHRLAYPIWAAAVEFSRTPGTQVVITEGLRLAPRQSELRAAGLSSTLNSKHLIGLGVDVGILINGELASDLGNYAEFQKVVARYDYDYNGQYLIQWGGRWKSLVDGCHFEL